MEIGTANRYTDLLENGVDVAIRNREFENDSAITVRRLTETKRVLETNDSQGVRAAALKLLGILLQPMYIIHEDVVTARLVPVLTEWGPQRVRQRATRPGPTSGPV